MKDIKKFLIENIKKLIVVSICFVNCVIIAGFYVRGCNSVSDVKVDRKPPVNPQKYNILAEQWNQSVIYADLGSSYYLPRSDPEGTIKALNAFVRPFYEFSTPEIVKELQEITKGRQYSFFVFYLEFLERHRVNDHVSFTVEQNSPDIKKVINRLTKQDAINAKGIKIIASMNNPCVYLKMFKDELHKKGVTRNLESCDDFIINKERYPNLYELIDKGEKE